jgi:phosphoglycolate phosphatase-like HAD superfamily hydrolase
MTGSFTRDDLAALAPQHETFVGVDSDGCVFDTMEIKQKDCFHPVIIAHWELEAIETYVRQCAEFVNLYSRWRGQNRFTALMQMFQLLGERPEVLASGIALPNLASLNELIASGVPLGNPALEQAAAETGDAELASFLRWSQTVNAVVAERVRSVPPFPWAREALETMGETSDVVCVSQTPNEALVREWDANGLTGCLRAIAGQELGTKTEHLALATKDRYAAKRVLMIGDAFGDMAAARENGALFYPILPGREDASWERFCREAYPRFLAGDYAGPYETDRIGEFEALLPDTPPWIER